MKLVDKKPEVYMVEDVFDLNVAKDEYVERWNQIWVQNKLDVIIGPDSQTTAVPHDTYGTSPYTTPRNLLDVSAHLWQSVPFVLVWGPADLFYYLGVVIPYGTADETIDKDVLVRIGNEQPPRPCKLLLKRNRRPDI
jgi:hypothetical protein